MITNAMPTTTASARQAGRETPNLLQDRRSPPPDRIVWTFRLPGAGGHLVLANALVTAIEVSGRDGEPSSVFYEIRPVS